MAGITYHGAKRRKPLVRDVFGQEMQERSL